MNKGGYVMKNLLENKVVYIIPCGAHKVKYIDILINVLHKYGARIYILPTPMARKIYDFDKDFKNCIVKCDFSKDESTHIPEEDVVLVAPCTFDTFNKVALGIADNYPLSVVHNAIGKKVTCILAPSMELALWENFALKDNLEKLSRQSNIKIVYPENIYDDAGKIVKMSMAPYEKIVDAVIHCFIKIKYEHSKVDYDISNLVEQHYHEFFLIGKQLEEGGYLKGSEGFIAKRIQEGILVTSTGSLVGNLEKCDLTLINSWNNKAILWSGSKIPTSEAPLVLELFEQYSDNVIIHGHCKAITYNSNMVKYASKEYLSYGSWGESQKITSLLNEFDGRAIMKLHGEIIIGDDFEKAFLKYKEMRYYER